MIIVSDTTPLRYLIEIEAVDILGALFDSILIPQKVAEELQNPGTPQKVKDWMQSLPAWLEVRVPSVTRRAVEKKACLAL